MSEYPHTVWPGPYHFVTGPAGSGKTFLVRERATRDPGALLCATTGIAAVNLGDAVTIHATLKYFNTASLVEHYTSGWLQSRMRKLRAGGVTRYLIDEVSMMEAEQLTIITRAVEELNSEAAVMVGHEPELGVTLVGDFLQLPPIEGQFAFESPEWGRYAACTETLTTIRRQADPAFIEALRALRVGETETALPILQPCFQPRYDPAFTGTTIFSRNLQVDTFNRVRHDALEGTPWQFPATITGTPLKDWTRLIPEVLRLKPGALVMILANRYEDEDLLYANGDLGTVVDANPERKIAHVQLARTGMVETVPYILRQNLQPPEAGKKAKTVIGEIQYLPLRLAYASTVHKAQGLTLDRVQVDPTDPFFRSPGMLYVALSRARSLEGLTICGQPAFLAVRNTLDPRVAAWR